MTDYFALLGQPRVPWLEPEALKEVFRQKTLEQHPDSRADKSEGEFAELNAAYQVLQDPKRRLHHLLELNGHVPASTNQIPPELQKLFLQIGGLNQRTTQLLEKMRAASTPLSKSLLKADVANAEKEVGELRDKVRELSVAAEERLWRTDAKQLDQISDLYQRFAYLGRWSEQLDEMAFELAS